MYFQRQRHALSATVADIWVPPPLLAPLPAISPPPSRETTPTIMLNKMDLILVTGGHGFIGGHVARRLHAEGYRIRVADIVSNPPSGQQAIGEVYIGNLCDPMICAEAVRGVDVVLHFAATMGGMGTIHADNDFIIYQENHAMTLNLLAASKAAAVRGFFYASSACVYPESLQTTAADVSLAEGDVWTNPPPHPQGLYGLEKLASELLLSQHASRLQIRIARFHNVFGREKAPAALLRKAIAADLLHDPHVERRSFCFIDDAVEAILRLLASNCSTPRLAEIAVEVARLDARATSYHHLYGMPLGVGSRNSNNTFVKSILGWEPAFALEEGMRITGEWIRGRIAATTSSMGESEKVTFLRTLQKSDVVDLAADATTFAILLPVTSRGSRSPQDCLDNLAHFARSLRTTTADDVSRLGERYRVRIYIAIDEDDAFLWRTEGKNAVEPIFREHGFVDVTTLPPCTHPRGHVCALWHDSARRAYEDKCDYFVLMGDDVVLQDANWMSSVHNVFVKLSAQSGLPHGIGCVAFTDTSFPGMPTFPVVHRTHLDIFQGDVIPEGFTNQDGDPFLYQLYRRWGTSTMIPSRIHNELGGSGTARYEKVHAAGWTFQPLDDATSAVEDWLRSRGDPALVLARKLTLDVIVPCYRVDMRYIDAFLSLQPSSTCTVMFIIIVDNPHSPRIHDLLEKYGRRPDVRIRINAQNLGASASRNRGLQESAAEWVHFLDDDVAPQPNLLVQAEKAIRARPDAAGFVGNAYFPSADTVFTAAVHLAGVTFFWDIAEKISEDVPWGVTANLIARRNVLDGVVFNLQFPKTGGGEDIDYCRRKRDFSVAKGRKPFYGAPNVKVTHPWWNGGRRSYWRFYLWSKGDGGLIKLYPVHSYRDITPNTAESLLMCCLIFVTGCVLRFSNILHDILRHLVLQPDRVQYMQTTVRGVRWFFAIVEGAVIRIFSEWGRVVGLLERGEFTLLLKRFDWFCGVWGDGPRREEMMNNQVKMALALVLFALFTYLR
ncbi:NAD-dependent epimerase/dehydratase [Cerioporus squamosus]|nr:NAD-dependent epimerase/dehydratase [Cerioporus squamosus]